MSSLSEKPDPSYRPLADVSLALLLFLTKRTALPNPHRDVLARLGNTNINVSDLHYTILANINNRATDQLFQRLLMENFFYRRFVIVATDLSKLVLPLTTSIYQRSADTREEVARAVTVLRVLSMDELFCQAVHTACKVNASQITW